MRKVVVRKHSRKLSSGKRVSVVKHKRSVDGRFKSAWKGEDFINVSSSDLERLKKTEDFSKGLKKTARYKVINRINMYADDDDDFPKENVLFKDKHIGDYEKAVTKNWDKEYYYNLRIYRNTSVVRGSTVYDLMIFRGRSKRPEDNFYFSNLKRREDYISNKKKTMYERAVDDAKRRDKNKFIANKVAGANLVKVGDLFVTSWGYDQTNYDYVVVIEVSPTGKTVVCRRTSHETLGYSGQAYVQKPVNKPFGDSFRLRVKADYSGDDVSLVGSYPFLNTGEGSRRRGYFSRVSDGDKFYETDTMFGH